MAKDSLYDLNNHLFEQLEYVRDRDIKGAELTEEIKRTEATAKIAGQIIANANLLLKAKMAANNSMADMTLPQMLEDKKST